MDGFNLNNGEESNSNKPLYYDEDSNKSRSSSNKEDNENKDEIIELLSSEEEEDNDNEYEDEKKNEQEESKEKEQTFNPLDFFKHSHQELSMNSSVPLVTGQEDEQFDDEHSQDDGSYDEEEDDDMDEDKNFDVDELFNNSSFSNHKSEKNNEAEKQEHNHNNEQSEEEQDFSINSDQIDEMEEDDEKENNKLIELALANAENNDDEIQDENHVPHFDNILKQVSEIKGENTEDELKQKNKFLLDIAKKLSSQASSFRTKFTESVIEKDELIGDHDKDIESREEELDSLQQDIDELELQNRKDEAKINDLENSNKELRTSRKRDVSAVMDKLEKSELELKKITAKFEFESKSKLETEKLYQKSKIDNENLLKKIFIAEHSRDTDIGLLKSEIVLKDSHIQNLQNQIESFKRAGINNNVSIDDYDSLVDSFAKASDEIKLLQSKLNERDNDLRELISAPVRGSTINNGVEFLKKELISEKLQKEQLQSQLEGIVSDLEISIPAMKEYKHKCSILETSLLESNELLDGVEAERNQLFEMNLLNENKIDELNDKIQDSNQLNIDLANQVQAVLLQLTLRTDTNLLSILSPTELNLIKKLTNKNNNSEQTKNIQAAISDNLVIFNDIRDLQEKNQQLLLATRKLGENLETLQSFKDDISKADSLETTIQKLEHEKSSYEKKIKILVQEHKNLNTLSDLANKKFQKQDDKTFIANYKVQISNLEAQLVESHERILKQSEENSTSMSNSLQKITELNFEISSLKSDNSMLKFKYEQLAKEKESLESLLTKEQKGRDELNELLVANEKVLRQVELEYKDAQEAKLNEQKKNNDLTLQVTSLDEKITQIKNENNTLIRKADTYKADLERIQGLKKELDYLLRHTDSEYWSNLASLEQKLKEKIENNDDTTNNNDFSSVSTILESFEKHMKYHSNQAQEFRKLLAEKDDIINKLNINNRVQELVDELDNKKKEYDDLSSILDSKNNEIIQLNEQLSTSEVNIDSITKSCDDLKEELTNVHETISAKNRQIGELNGVVNQLNEENANLEMKLKNLDTDFKQKVKNLEVDYDELEHACKEFEERFNESKKENEELSKKILVIKQDNETTVEDLRSKIEVLNKSLEENNSELAELKQKLTNSENELSSLKDAAENKEENLELIEAKTKIEELTRKTEELNSKLSSIQPVSSEIGENSDVLQKQLDDEREEVEKLKQSLVESNDKKSLLSESLAELEKSKKECEDKILKLESDIATLSAKQKEVHDNDNKSELEDKIDKLEKENREQRASVLKVKLLEQKLKRYENQSTSNSVAPVDTPTNETAPPKQKEEQPESLSASNSIPPPELISQETKQESGEKLQTEEPVDEKVEEKEKPFSETLKESENTKPAFSFSFKQPENTNLPPQQKPAFFTGNSSNQSLFGQTSFGQSDSTQSIFGNKRPFTPETETGDNDDVNKKPKFTFGLGNGNQLGGFGKPMFGNFSPNNTTDDKKKEDDKKEDE